MNDIIFVTLTEKGQKEFRKYEKENYQTLKDIFPQLPFLEQKELIGKVSFQLWELFSIFGSDMMNGSAAVFVDNSIEIK